MTLEEELLSYEVSPFTDEGLSYEEIDDLYASDIEVEEPVPETPAGVTVVFAPRGRFYTDRYLAPDIQRDSFIQSLHEEAVSSNYYFYAAMNNPRLVHLKRHHTIDFYTLEFQRVMSIFLQYYGKGDLVVVTGFRSPWEIGIHPHSVGIAIDIKADTEEQRRRIMNAAFAAGIPTIIPGGEIAKGEGYVHLDLAEKAPYIYDEGIYEGPWS